MPECGRVLVVEDDPVMGEILQENLSSASCEAAVAEDGETAWRMLSAEPDSWETVLLDRRLPDMDGLELLQRLKKAPDLAHLPVILQTAMDAHQDVLEGLQAGAYYYLTKPIESDTLIAIVRTAVYDHRSYQAMRREVTSASHTLRHLDEARFSFRSPAQARDIASLLANTCRDAQKVVVGLTELMLNAVEHGNLGITYAEKTILINDSRLTQEVERRLALPQYARRRVQVSFERKGRDLEFLVQDQGAGFDWQPFLEMQPERIFDNHGRGIAMAAKYSFERLEYQGSGNRVLAVARDAGHVA